MSRANTRHGAYHVLLADEITRILKQLQEMGIKNPSKLEATALIAEKNKKAKMTRDEVKNFLIKIRGIA